MDDKEKISKVNFAYCGKCGRALSDVGKEIGLIIPFNNQYGFIIACANTRCAGIPDDIQVRQLQNYWLNRGW